MRSLFLRTALLSVSVFLSGISTATIARAQPVLYASDAGTGQLYTLNPSNATPTLVGSYNNGGTMGGLAYDPIHDILFGSDVATNSLYSINQSTGAATLIGPFGGNVGVVQALAFDSTTGNLYGAYGSVNAPSLYQISVSTGTATLIGGLARSLSGLTFDSVTHVLYGSSTSLGNFGVFTLNPSTGQTLSQVSTDGFNGISFNPVSNILYGISNGGNSSFGGLTQGLYTINTQTGVTSLVGSPALTNPLDLQFALRPAVTATAPEPGSLALLLPVLGTVGMVLRKRRKR